MNPPPPTPPAPPARTELLAGGPSADAALLSTGFGALGGDAAAPPRRAAQRSAFDVCHVGVALRAVLFVHGVLALGVAFSASDVGHWWRLFAPASTVTLPALLVWLFSACVGQRLLARLPETSQWLLATAWGGLCAAASSALWSFAPWQEPAGGAGLHLAAGVATGAAMAFAFFHWLRQRARLELPAATTARLAELQSRIRPHFLFNTLNTAIALVRVDPSRAEAVLEDLAELFRVALADAGPHAQTTLGEEIELARRYLAIEQLRFGERLQVLWEIDAQCDAAALPPLLLQPLVENAVKHGVEPSAGGGLLRVRTRLRRGQVEILVANSVPPQASVPGHGMALRNVHERLRLMHDVAADFSARRDGEVYRVRIVVPL